MALRGLVLHASRCGSTFVLAALATWPGVVGVDEAPELDDALAQARAGRDTDRLGTVLHELGRRGAHVIVKTDAWHALELERLVDAARVPWVFVHRDPGEILVSHARQPGSHSVPGVLPPVWFGPPTTSQPLEHAADVLSAILTAVTPHADAHHLLDHATLPEAILARVGPHFGLDPADVDGGELAAVCGRSAKQPHLSYVDDRAAKQRAITPAIALLAARVAPAYRALLDRSRVAS